MTKIYKYMMTALLALLPLAAMADEESDSLRRAIAQARSNGNLAQETLERERLAVSFYNRLMYDSLIVVAPEQMAFYAKHQDWEHFYYVWRMLVSAYIYSERSNMALRECRKMYDDATRRSNDYGIAMSSHVMGLAYSNMHYYEEAQKAIERGLNMMITKGEPFMQVSIYGDYCEVLSARQDWKALLPATEGWHKALLEWGRKRGMPAESVDSTIYATYCFVAQAKAQRGLKNYDEAGRLLRLATRNAKLYGDDSDEGYWHHVVAEWASYYYDLDDYAKALQYNDEALYWARKRDIDSELSGVEQQRAEILMGLGRYREASELWQRVQKASEERNLHDAKNQLSEMNTIFQLDEMEMQQQQTKTRYTLIIASLVVVALLLLSLFWLRSSKREAQKNRELAIALDRAQESDKMKTAFIQHVSHEIRTPLNIITGFTQVLNNSGFDIKEQERSEMLAKIEENTNMMTQIVSELLEVSENASTVPIARNDEVGVVTLCQKAVLASGIQATSEVDFKIQNSVGDDVTVRTDEQSVVKILKHLLQNAAKFTEHGQITLDVSQGAGEVRFAVVDTGIGVPEDARERIFQRFEKLDMFREGIGLGLNVARSQARRIGGDVVLARSDHHGSTFVLSIPNEKRA